MQEFFQKLSESISTWNPYLIICEAVFFAVVFYYMFKMLKDNNAMLLVWFFVGYMLIVGIVFGLVDALPNILYLLFPIIYVVCMIILFPTEIKRAVWNFHNSMAPDLKHIDQAASANTAKECVDEIIKALQNMSKNDIGALIILATGNMPNSILESGVNMDSEISSALIESIFFPKTPLHDGAMVIKGTKIQAASCFLPLSQEVNLPKDLGTRHRAGIGITETINVTAIIVSEETGVISIANGGKIKRYADSEMLRQTLNKFYTSEQTNA